MSYPWPWAGAGERRPEGLGLARPRETAVLATGLVVGLVGVAPTLALLFGALGFSSPLPLLAAVAVVVGAYGLTALLVDRVALGAVVALVVTATFAAEVPLVAGSNAYPGSLDPALWLFALPLGALLGLLTLRGEFTVGSLTTVEFALGAFVVWSAAVAFVGPVPRPDVALAYAVFSLACLLAFAVAARSVASGVVSFPGVLATFLIAVGGHVAFAAVQVAHQGVFGLSQLGETTQATSPITIPLGSFHIGVFASGFTGGSGPLAMLIVLAVPVALAAAVRHEGPSRLGLLLAVVVAAAILRFTAKDSSRGAVLLGVTTLAGVLLWTNRDRLGPPARAVRRLGRYAPLLLVALGVLFLPSRTARGSAGGVGGGGPSIPFFNLDTLGVRITQYVVGTEVFLAHPVTGVGGGNFRYTAAAEAVPALEGISMHNLYLSLLVGTGVPGFALYSTALLAVFVAGWRAFRSPSDERVLVAGVLAALLGGLAVLFWELPLRYTSLVPFWLLAGALVGYRRRRSAASHRPQGAPTDGVVAD